MFNILNKIIKKTSKVVLIFSLIFSWVFQIPLGSNSYNWFQFFGFPTKTKVTLAAPVTISYVGGVATSTASSTSTPLVLSLTGLSLQEGDLVLVASGWPAPNNYNPGVSTAGYTELFDLYFDDTNDINYSVNWKLMGSSPDSSVACNYMGTINYAITCAAYVLRGVNQTNPFDVTGTSTVAGKAVLFDSPEITPVTSGALVVSMGLSTNDDVSGDATITVPVGYSNSFNYVGNASVNSCQGGMATKFWSGSGAENPAAWTDIISGGNKNKESWAAVTLAIRPATIPDVPVFYDSDGTNQIAFNNIRQSTTTPTFRVSVPSSSNYNRIQIELNASSTFIGASSTQIFSGTYASGTVHNLNANSLSPGLTTTDGVTYYVRVRASADGGTNYSAWSTTKRTFTYKSSGNPDWFQTTQTQFNTGTPFGSIEITSSGTVQLMDITGMYFTDFSEYATSSQPSDWTQRWATSTALWKVYDDSTAPGGKSLYVGGTATNTKKLLSWNTLDNISADADIFFTYKVATTSTDAFVVARASGGALGDTKGVRSGYDLITNGKEIGYYNAGSFTVSTSSQFTPSTSTWYMARASFIGNNYKYKTWLATGTEPLLWDIDATSSVVTNAGWIGLGNFISTGTSTKFGIFSVNTAGGLAPTTAPSTTGSFLSSPISFNSVPGMVSWDQAIWSETETSGSISMQVYYSSSSACDTIISDSDLIGNSSGFANSPINLSNLSTTTYSSVCLKAVFKGTGSTTPVLNDWSVTWSSIVGTPTITQTNYRWKTNDGSETNEGYAVPTNEPLLSGVHIGDRSRLRIQLSNTGSSTASNYEYRLEYASNNDSCSSWVTIPSSTTTGPWSMDWSSNVSDNTPTTDSSGIENPIDKTFVSGYVKTEGNQTPAVSLNTSQFTEIDYSIRSTSNVVTDLIYCFRATNAGTSNNFIYTVWPQISVDVSVSHRRNRGGENTESSENSNNPERGGNIDGGSSTETSSTTVPTSTTTPSQGGDDDVGFWREYNNYFIANKPITKLLSFYNNTYFLLLTRTLF